MERFNLLTSIISSLGVLCSRVRLANSLNLTDINVHCENFYRDLLSLVYGYNLINMNHETTNADAIDLGDAQASIAFQVTATNSLSKTRATVTKFCARGHDKLYRRLVMLVITEKLEHKSEAIKSDNGYVFDIKNDLWSVENLIRDIQNKSSEEIRAIESYLTKELGSAAPEYVPTEIETFMNLIYLLSEGVSCDENDGYREDPDPQGKIKERFADHAIFLEGLYKDLYIEYGHTLEETIRTASLGQPRIRRLGLHLKVESDLLLTRHGGDARISLEELVERYCGHLGRRGSSYDRSAVRFFLVDQLIRCNVFPNKVNVSE